MADKPPRKSGFNLTSRLARGTGIHHGSSEKPRRRSNDRHQQLPRGTQGFQLVDTTGTRPSEGGSRHPFGGSDRGPTDKFEAKRRKSHPASQGIRRPPLPVKTTPRRPPLPVKTTPRRPPLPKQTMLGAERGVCDLLQQQSMLRTGANVPRLASIRGRPAQRVMRAAAAGDPAARWIDGNHHGAATYEASRRSSRTSSSASYAPRRGYGRRKRQRELKQRGGDAEAATTLSSSDEDEEGVEEGGAGGVQSFSLHDDKVYFGRTPMVATPSKVAFTTAGLRLPVPEIWGEGGPDIAVVPYDAIQCISYCTEGKPAFMSIELKPGAFKTGVIVASVDGFKVSRASKFDDVCDRRVLAPLRDGAAFLQRLPRVTALLLPQQPPPMAGSRGNEGCLLKKLEFALATPLLDNIPLYRRRNTRSSTRKGGRGTGEGGAEPELKAKVTTLEAKLSTTEQELHAQKEKNKQLEKRNKQLVKTNVQLVREAGKVHSVQAAAVAPEAIDLRNLPKHASEGSVADRWKRDAMTNLVHQGHKRLREVKKEREEALLDVEDQEETTKLTTLALDRWQGYCDELKSQMRAGGQEPLAWNGRGQPPKFR
jgi:hypothetical protein